jgi:hypothetical protein
MQWRIVVEFTINQKEFDELGTLDDEANNIKDCWLDAIGFPDNVDIIAKGISIEYLDEKG